jgi:hypothetical protein
MAAQPEQASAGGEGDLAKLLVATGAWEAA